MITFKSHQALSIIEPYLPSNPIIVEAGAFDGTDTKKMALRWPHATIHAFEPAEEICQQLENNTCNLDNVHRYAAALSDKNGHAMFYVSEKPDKPGKASQAGSLHKPKDRLSVSPLIFPRAIQVQTITLATWMQQHHVVHIDLLWLDTQGHEHSILCAAQPILKNIAIIFAEVAFIQAYEGQCTYEPFVMWMKEHGFVCVARDFIDTSTSFFGNALFVNSEL